MSQVESRDSSVPLWWILVFLVLALGLGAYAINVVGGSLVTPPPGLLPVLV
ncbi:hypothetical protein [Halobaculum sp. D14]|uniref:hypothetical protein n=1 Tax=unclassified Halobaculum TaxID=2640896 RepID=UPI003EB9B5E1